MRADVEFLRGIARSYEIKIFYKQLPENLLGKADAETKSIYLDVSLLDNPRQHKCVLAEELGHILFPPRPGHLRYHSKDFFENENCSMIKHKVAQDERKARDWATSVLFANVDLSRIKSVNAHSISELADYFDVEPWFIKHRIGFLRRKSCDAGRWAQSEVE